MSDTQLANALTTSRAALVGPFDPTPLTFKMPVPLDEPSRLAQWAAGPRLQVCELELLAGLRFDVTQSNEQVTLGFVNLDKKPFKDVALAKLKRPTHKVFTQQLGLVALYADLREDRNNEIMAQIPGGLAFWASILGLQGHRHKYTLELIDLAMSLAIHVEMRFKHAFACPRPDTLSPQIQSMIPTPGHASWPSGHSTEAFLTATLLQALLPQGSKYQEQLQRLAARIAVNRTVAGLHYPVDTAVGRLLGTALADFLVARCKGGKLHERGFDGRKFHDAKGHVIDFDLRVSMSDNKSGYYQLLPNATTVAASPLLAFMWDKASKECQPLK